MKKRRSKKPNLLKEARQTIKELQLNRNYIGDSMRRVEASLERVRETIQSTTYADKNKGVEQMVVWLVTEYKQLQARCGEMQTAINSMKDITSRHTGNWPEPYRTETTTSA
jgi:predicted nuclease with TOPRIM domain